MYLELTVPHSGVICLVIAIVFNSTAVAFHLHRMEVKKMKLLKSIIFCVALAVSVASIAVVPAMSCPYSDGEKVEKSST